jgi:hypothetical protein
MYEFTSKMISQFVYAFGQTALRCKEIGVDGVEIHAVHEGYLLDQFAMPYTNHRTDAYGGSLENRLRFTCEIVREIKKVCGEDYPVSLRYSVRSMTKGFNSGAVPGEEFTEIGRTMEESEKAVKILEEAGILVLPLYMLEHGMVSVSVSDYGVAFDSGCAGFAFVKRSALVRNYLSVNGLRAAYGTDDWKAVAKKVIRDEVEEYDQYLQGDCYYYDIDEFNNETHQWEKVDMSGGFFTDKFGDKLAAYLAEEAGYGDCVLMDEDEAKKAGMPKEWDVDDFINAYMISRETVLEMLDEIATEVADGYGFQYGKWREYVCNLNKEDM